MRGRLLLAFAIGALPSVFALAACTVDGATPNCSSPDSKCEPAAENANPDARADAKNDGGPDARVDADGNAPDAADASDSSDAKSDATDADADAKTG